eukprot:m.14028 g.14028  ORF g.14028 m.14028 type:complete len:846 (+) comp4739_c0_seq1:209-2746(+)
MRSSLRVYGWAIVLILPVLGSHPFDPSEFPGPTRVAVPIGAPSQSHSAQSGASLGAAAEPTRGYDEVNATLSRHRRAFGLCDRLDAWPTTGVSGFRCSDVQTSGNAFGFRWTSATSTASLCTVYAVLSQTITCSTVCGRLRVDGLALQCTRVFEELESSAVSLATCPIHSGFPNQRCNARYRSAICKCELPPTIAPTRAPTRNPTSLAPVTARPTAQPTAVPTRVPTAPTTAEPTAIPSAHPTAMPSVAPTGRPTVAPTAVPSASPTARPTFPPTAMPSATPTASPTSAPTNSPTAAPTALPTGAPTAPTPPTGVPSLAPTATPTVAPTAAVAAASAAGGARSTAAVAIAIPSVLAAVGLMLCGLWRRRKQDETNPYLQGQPAMINPTFGMSNATSNQYAPAGTASSQASEPSANAPPAMVVGRPPQAVYDKPLASYNDSLASGEVRYDLPLLRPTESEGDGYLRFRDPIDSGAVAVVSPEEPHEYALPWEKEEPACVIKPPTRVSYAYIDDEGPEDGTPPRPTSKAHEYAYLEQDQGVDGEYSVPASIAEGDATIVDGPVYSLAGGAASEGPAYSAATNDAPRYLSFRDKQGVVHGGPKQSGESIGSADENAYCTPRNAAVDGRCSRRDSPAWKGYTTPMALGTLADAESEGGGRGSYLTSAALGAIRDGDDSDRTAYTTPEALGIVSGDGGRASYTTPSALGVISDNAGHEDQPWALGYVGAWLSASFDTATAQTALTSGSHDVGAYCFRAGRDDSVVLSVLSKRGGVLHFRVVDLGYGRIKLSKATSSETTFDSLNELLEFYACNSVSPNIPHLTDCVPPPLGAAHGEVGSFASRLLSDLGD